jgi:hypothetical protein
MNVPIVYNIMALDYSDLMEIIETEVRNFIEAKIPEFCSRVCEEYDQIDPESLEDLTRDFFLEGGGGSGTTIESKKIPTLPQSGIKTSAAVTSATLATSGLNDDQCTAMTAKKQRCKHKRKPGSLFCTSHSSKATTSGEVGISSSLVAADQIKVLKYGEKEYIYNRISFDIYAMPVGGIGMVSEAGNQINISKLQHVGIMRGSQVIFEGEVETAPQPYQINQTLPETQKSILTTTPKLGSGVPAIATQMPTIATQIPTIATQMHMPQIASQMPVVPLTMPTISRPINLSGITLPNL